MNRSATRPRLLSLVLVAIAIGAGVWGYLYAQSRGNAPRYRFARVERGPLIAAVSASGTVNAVITVLVGSQVSGQIKELHVDFNSVVRRGQVIALIDPEIFEARVTQAQADLDSAHAAVLNQQAQVERARADVESARAAFAEGGAQTIRMEVALADSRRDVGRKTELFRRQLIPRSDYDSAEALADANVAQLNAARAKEQSLGATIESAKANLRVAEAMLQGSRAVVKQRQAALDQARIDLEHTTIRAPVNGVVVSRAVDVGQTVAASLQAPTLFTIAQDLTKMQVETSVDEADIGRVVLDGPAAFTVDAFPHDKFSGRIVQIRKAAQVIQNVVTYSVVVGVDNPERKLLQGMTANVKLVVAEKRDVLKVPNAALRFRAPGVAEGGPASAPRPGRTAHRDDGQQSVESRDRLVRRLGITREQEPKLDRILEEGRRQMTALKAADLAEAERQAKARTIKEATRARIREILTSEQRGRYDRVAGGETRGRAGGRVWVLDRDGALQSVALGVGLTDGSATEVLEGDVKEGQEVIVGLAGGAGAPTSTRGSAPRVRL